LRGLGGPALVTGRRQHVVPDVDDLAIPNQAADDQPHRQARGDLPAAPATDAGVGLGLLVAVHVLPGPHAHFLVRLPAPAVWQAATPSFPRDPRASPTVPGRWRRTR